jgi:hypothetical protein
MGGCGFGIGGHGAPERDGIWIDGEVVFCREETRRFGAFWHCHFGGSNRIGYGRTGYGRTGCGRGGWQGYDDAVKRDAAAIRGGTGELLAGERGT